MFNSLFGCFNLKYKIKYYGYSKYKNGFFTTMKVLNATLDTVYFKKC